MQHFSAYPWYVISVSTLIIPNNPTGRNNPRNSNPQNHNIFRFSRRRGLVRQLLSLHYLCRTVDFWKTLQILPFQMGFPCWTSHLRTRFTDMRCCAHLECSHCWSEYCWPWSCGSFLGLYYYHHDNGPIESSSDLHGANL